MLFTNLTGRKYCQLDKKFEAWNSFFLFSTFKHFDKFVLWPVCIWHLHVSNVVASENKRYDKQNHSVDLLIYKLKQFSNHFFWLLCSLEVASL